MKVVVLSHGHPAFSKGGAELAAYYLFQGINELPGHDAWFFGRADDRMLHSGTQVVAYNDREFLIRGHAGIFDLSSTIDLSDAGELARTLRDIAPDVIHFHHYVYLGVDMLFAAKRICPNARIVLTLHEYIAICMHNGQMVKTTGELCYKGGMRECQQCFPHWSGEDIFLRTEYIKTMFRRVDRFISPSAFLKQRYVEWGLDPSSIEVIENGLPPSPRRAPRELGPREGRGRFGYFGQINPYKGLDVVLQAFARLKKSTRSRVSLAVYGSGLSAQRVEFQEKVRGLLEENADCVSYHGAYEPAEVDQLMETVDWVLLGSVWWENSPLVIQEAYRVGRPVVCPDIGGMAEKVQPAVGGVRYRARDSVSLAALVEKISDPGCSSFDDLQKTLPAYPSIAACVQAHLPAYKAR